MMATCVAAFHSSALLFTGRSLGSSPLTVRAVCSSSSSLCSATSAHVVIIQNTGSGTSQFAIAWTSA